MSPIATKIGVGSIVIVCGCGAVLFFTYRGTTTGIPVGAEMGPPPSIHSASWYVAHQDIMRADVTICQDNVAALPSADCQNANTAESQLYSAELAKAATQNK
jgi:hypothetical protein